MTTELRRHPRVRIQAPFACSFARLGLQRWLAAERTGLGVVLDVSLKGAKVMSQAFHEPGRSAWDQSALCPDQTAILNVDATVRWGNRHTFGLEFTAVSHLRRNPSAKISLPWAFSQGQPVL